MSASMCSFQQVWDQKVREGYQYGPDALEQVKFGWDLAMQQIEKLQKERDDYSSALKEIREQFDLLGWD